MESLSKETIGVTEILPTINGKKVSLSKLGEFGFSIPYTIDAPEYLLGVYTTKTQSSQFVILRVTSYSNAFSVMGRFEETIIDNIGNVFNFDFKTKEESTRIHSFYDVIINNKNIRSVNTLEGVEFLFYTFLNDSTLLIAKDRALITEIQDRLRSLKI